MPVSEVYDRDQAYNGPYVPDAPDLVVGFAPGYRVAWETVTGGFGEAVLSDNARPWGGDHNMNPPEVPGQPNVTQLKIMIQKLLTERFQLKFHNEKKELGVYAITIAKTGAKLTKSQADPNGLPTLMFGRGAPGMAFNVRNATLAEVASVIQGNVLDKPVVDQTGLSDKYDFVLKFTPDPGQLGGPGGPQAPAADSLDAPPDILTAFQQQLGLKVENTRTPVDVIVIDRVEKPSEN